MPTVKKEMLTGEVKKKTKPKKPTATKAVAVPKLNISELPPLYKCTRCGTITNSPVTKFYQCRNCEVLDGNDHFATICSKCANELFDAYRQRYDNEKFALLLVCQILGCYFSEPLYESLTNTKDSSFMLGYYFRALNGLQYKGKSFTSYLLELKNQDKAFKPKEEIVELMEARWTNSDRRNKVYCVNGLGYDPFTDDSYNDDDRKYLYNTMAAYLTDEVLEDPHKCSSCVAMIKTLLQIEELNTLINKEIKSINPDYAKIKAMSDTKNHLQQNVNQIAKDNGISAIGSGKKSHSTTSLTYIMKEMLDNGIDAVKANVIDARLSEAYKEIAQDSAKALFNELRYTSDDYAKMVAEQGEKIISQDEAIMQKDEEIRLLRIELSQWERDAKARKAKRADVIEADEGQVVLDGDSE